MLPSIWRKNKAILNNPENDFFDTFFYGWPTIDSEKEFKWSPRADIHETDTEIILDFELPGIEKNDIKVELKDNTLSVSGERKQDENIENAETRRIERHYGKYERTFTLPDTVKSEDVSAAYKNGILTLSLPKAEKAIPKEIAVEVK